MIKFDKVTKKFGKITALDELSFEIDSGQIVGFLGPNGAGKTTTMRIMVGLLAPNEGKVEIDNVDVEKEPLKITQMIGYLPENNPLYEDFKVWEYLKFISGVRRVDFLPNLKRVVGDCHLETVIGQKIEQLSKGYKQRVGLAAALMANPPILILDEPTIGLDPNQIVQIRKLIKTLSRKKTVILSTHILSEVQPVCQKVIIIHKGKIVTAGSLKKVTQGKSLEKIFQRLTLE